jgi:hypothetical protein
MKDIISDLIDGVVRLIIFCVTAVGILVIVLMFAAFYIDQREIAP